MRHLALDLEFTMSERVWGSQALGPVKACAVLRAVERTLRGKS